VLQKNICATERLLLYLQLNGCNIDHVKRKIMMITKETIYSKDVANKRLTVERSFDAPVALVWKAWTQSDLLDKWWAPKPWKANTTSMDFRSGGQWLYYMQGPDGSKHYCRVDFDNVVPNKSFATANGFCDEKGNINTEMPVMRWRCNFNAVDDATTVVVEITFDSTADLEKIIEMGFKEGFAMGHTNLDELLAALQ
jgi:uncharacterized protein YndB with AHSA1/START domain